MAAIEIGPANIRDVTYILANLREEDRLEISCQCRDDDIMIMATLCVQPGQSWVAYHKDVPTMVFGFSPQTLAGNTLSAWAFGARRSVLCIREITRWVFKNFVRDWLKSGNVTRIEARSIVGHTGAHRWLERTGAVLEGEIPGWGRDGETFLLYVWRRDNFTGRGNAGLAKLKKFIRR